MGGNGYNLETDATLCAWGRHLPFIFIFRGPRWFHRDARKNVTQLRSIEYLIFDCTDFGVPLDRSLVGMVVLQFMVAKGAIVAESYLVNGK